MFTVVDWNAHRVLPRALNMIKRYGVETDSRNGKVLQMPQPMTLQYDNPRQRIVWWHQRDANPFFHFFESLWMLAGGNDVAFPSMFVSTMKDFSDDGVTFNGAYGHRWRLHFGHDQLQKIAANLKENPQCRRQVLGMWDPSHDLGLVSKDLPCNTLAYFQTDPDTGNLNMMVSNRSNDLVWGALGANCVHFSMLQEFMAAAIGTKVGRYWQSSMNMHIYERHFPLMNELADKMVTEQDRYEQPVEHFPLVNVEPEIWMQDCTMFVDQGPIVGFRDPFFRRVATPLFHAFAAYKQKDNPHRFADAYEILAQCKDTAWMLACAEWLQRREAKLLEKQESVT